MTDPKKLLGNKLKNRLQQAPVTTNIEEVPELRTEQAARTNAATKPAAKKKKAVAATKKTTTPKSAGVARSASEDETKAAPSSLRPAAAAASADHSKTFSGSPKASFKSGFTQKLETLITTKTQPEGQHDSTEQEPEETQQIKVQQRQQVKEVRPHRQPKVRRPPRSPEEVRQIYRVSALYALAAIIVLLDQLTKSMAHSTLMDGSMRLTSWLDLILVFNPGAAFSLLANSGWQRPFLVGVSLVVSLVLIFWLPRTTRHKLILPLGLACILGGAVGNLIDRALYGYVIDFVSMHYQQLRFPTFNLADATISIGAGLLILDMLVGDAASRAERRAEKARLRQQRSHNQQQAAVPQQPAAQQQVQPPREDWRSGGAGVSK